MSVTGVLDFMSDEREEIDLCLHTTLTPIFAFQAGGSSPVSVRNAFEGI